MAYKPKPKTDPTKCDADKASGGKCKQVAGWGTVHLGFGRCKRHGGSAPGGIKHAIKEEVEAKRRTLIGQGYSVEGIDPGTLLLEELARSIAIVRWLEDMIAGDESGTTEGLSPGRSGGYEMGSSLIDIETTQGGIRYKQNIYWSAYVAERAQMAKVAKDCITVGLKEREVQLAERHGELMHRLFHDVFADPLLALNAEQRMRAPAIVRKHLALVMEAAPAEAV